MNDTDNTNPQENNWSQIFSGRLGTLTLVLILGMGLFAINQFVVATILPTVVRDIGGVDFYTWAFSLFAVGAIIGSASANPLRLVFGVRQAYAGAGLVLGIGLAGAALAPDMPTLVTARLIQGVGGGAVASSGYGLIAIAYPVHLRSKVLGLVSVIWGTATFCGPGFGAIFAEDLIWRGAFLSLLPLIFIFIFLAWKHVEGKPGEGRLSAIPYQRLALLALAVLLMSTTSLTENNWLRGLLIVLSIIFATLTFILDTRSKRNMFPRGATDITTELGAIYGILFLGSIVLAIVNTYSTYYLQALHGVSPLVAGYLFAIQSLMWTASALVVANLARNLETASIVTGLLFMLLATISIALTVDLGPVLIIAIGIGLTGLGLGATNNPIIQRIIAIVPESENHMAGTSVQTIRNIGISFGAAASGMVASAAGLTEDSGREVIAPAMQWVYGVNAGFAVLACLMIIPLLMARHKKRPPTVK